MSVLENPEYDMGVDVKHLSIIHDERGWLVEILKNEDISGAFGQIYTTVAYPGKVKGNHYHKKKTEWVYIVCGKAKMAFLNVETGESSQMTVADNTTVIKIPPMIAHGFKNTGSETLYVMIYSDKVYDRENPDSYPEEVLS